MKAGGDGARMTGFSGRPPHTPDNAFAFLVLFSPFGHSVAPKMFDLPHIK